MINSGIKIVVTNNMGRGLMAERTFKAGEWVADWTGGVVYRAKSRMQLPPGVRDHALQFAKDKWIDVRSPARLMNHSCEPNCGMRGLFRMVATRDVAEGEFLLFDYEMTENSDWRMACHCRSPHCRKTIGAYDNMPAELKRKYRHFISPWLSRVEECAAVSDARRNYSTVAAAA